VFRETKVLGLHVAHVKGLREHRLEFVQLRWEIKSCIKMLSNAFPSFMM
jgi:hypothetical protein